MIEANQAIIQLNDKKIPNTNINFKLNWANQNSEGCRNLYVGNLPPEVDYIELYSLFKSKYNYRKRSIKRIWLCIFYRQR